MEKRALLAIVLSFIVLYIFQTYFIPHPKQVPVKTEKKVAKTNVEKKRIISTKNIKKIKIKSFSEKTTAITKTFPFENLDLKGEIFIPGGGIRNLILKHYKVSVAKNSPPVTLIGKKGSFIWEVEVNGRKFIYFPFSVSKNTDEFMLNYKNSYFAVTDVVRYGKKGYLVSSKFYYKNLVSMPVDLKVFLTMYYKPQGESSRYFFKGALVDQEQKLRKITEKTLRKKGRQIYSGDIKWAGFSNRYFLQAVLFNSPGAVVSVEGLNKTSMVMRIQLLDKALDPGEVISKNLRFYLGPKKLSILKDVGGDLHRAVDFGIWGIIARPILALLNLFNIIFHNYGLSIIFLTILIKIIFYPLTLKSYQSMAKLKDLQPMMEEIKKKYADDKEKMNQELMELYRKYKVNPMGGCLPTLIQIPIFIALYYVLLRAIELRHAYFLLWIKDLSAPETLVALSFGGFHLPIRVLPLLMGVTMYLQQKLTPSTMDKSQQMIFTFLPIIFTFLFYGLPSGLMLYWTTNNIISIYQQVRINKFLENQKGEKKSKGKK